MMQMVGIDGSCIYKGSVVLCMVYDSGGSKAKMLGVVDSEHAFHVGVATLENADKKGCLLVVQKLEITSGGRLFLLLPPSKEYSLVGVGSQCVGKERMLVTLFLQMPS